MRIEYLRSGGGKAWLNMASSIYPIGNLACPESRNSLRWPDGLPPLSLVFQADPGWSDNEHAAEDWVSMQSSSAATVSEPLYDDACLSAQSDGGDDVAYALSCRP